LAVSALLIEQNVFDGVELSVLSLVADGIIKFMPRVGNRRGGETEKDNREEEGLHGRESLTGQLPAQSQS
jgi:hypothetical protein